MRPETRGFLFGLSLGVAALAGFGAAQIGGEDRYELEAATTGSSATAYLVDKVTGQVWGASDSSFWQAKTQIAK